MKGGVEGELGLVSTQLFNASPRSGEPGGVERAFAERMRGQYNRTIHGKKDDGRGSQRTQAISLYCL